MIQFSFDRKSFPPENLLIVIETRNSFILRKWIKCGFDVTWYDENDNYDDSIQNAFDRQHWLSWSYLPERA